LGCCWDPRSCKWLIKEGPKGRIFTAFQKLSDHTKACVCVYVCMCVHMYTNWAYFELKKKVCVFIMCLRFLKKSVLKLLDCTVYMLIYKCGHRHQDAIPQATDWIPMLELLFAAVTCYRMNVQTICFFGKTFSMSIHKFYFQNCI
jgi:hypothetical protein